MDTATKAKMQAQYDREIKVIRKKAGDHLADLEFAHKLWYNLNVLFSDPEIHMDALSDEQRIDIVCKDANNYKFYSTYPIVARYMICNKMYSWKAFLLFIKKIKSSLDDKDSRLNWMDKWLSLQADYVKLLYIQLHKDQGNHYSVGNAQKVWQNTFNILKKERQAYEEMYRKKETFVANEEMRIKLEKMREVDYSTLSDEEQQQVLVDLQNRVYRQRHDTLIKTIEAMPIIPAKCISGFGKNVHAAASYEEELKFAEMRKKYNIKVDTPSE
jgi:hypothetical protein